jgi:hypothetical protein
MGDPIGAPREPKKIPPAAMPVRFGAMSPALAVQFGVKSSVMRVHQTSADAITRLYLHGLLTTAEARRARVRLLGKAVRAAAEATR